jgi:hypothetical protein
MFRFDIDGETGPIQVNLFARSSAEVTSVGAVGEPCGPVNCLRLVLALEVSDFFGLGTTRRLFRLYLSTDPGVSAHDYQ